MHTQPRTADCFEGRERGVWGQPRKPPEKSPMTFKHPGEAPPESNVPQGDRCQNYRTCVRFEHATPTTAEALQRRRERLELAAIAAGSRRPEQTANALLVAGGGL
jgi:hypothetical protein